MTCAFATGAPHGWSLAAGTVGAYGCLFRLQLPTRQLLRSFRLLHLPRLLHLLSDRSGRFNRCLGSGWWRACGSRRDGDLAAGRLRLSGTPATRACSSSILGRRPGWWAVSSGNTLGRRWRPGRWAASWSGSTLGRRSGWRRGGGTLRLCRRFAWRRSPLTFATGAPHRWLIGG